MMLQTKIERNMIIQIGDIPDYPYRILIIRDSRSGKNVLLDLIDHQPDIDKILLYAKYPYEAKHQFLINKGEKVGLKYCNDVKVFIEYSDNRPGCL